MHPVSSQNIIKEIKSKLFEIQLNPFFQKEEIIKSVTVISEEGKTNDLNAKNLFGHSLPKEDDVARYVAMQQQDGSWKDINYKDPSLSKWQPSGHVNRLLIMSKLYVSNRSKYYQNKQLSESLHRGINYWFSAKPICKNWWYNQIGIPQEMGLVFLFLEKELSKEEKLGALEVMNKSGFRMTGQNKVWLAGNVLLKALLINDETLVKAARDTIASEIFITANEGVQSDYSFHQHGAQQQMGNYGLTYLSSLAYYAQLFSTSALSFTASQLYTLRNYLFDGLDWVVWKGMYDVSACNRQLFKKTQKGKALAFCVAANQLKQSDLPNASKYDDLINRNLIFHNSLETYRAKHFWRSDLTVFRSPQSYFSIRSCSPRLIGTEFTNGENKKGHFISDGFTSIMRRGDEYAEIFPYWDWNRLPGVTAPVLATLPQKLSNDNYKNGHDFVGGLIRNANGISTFHLLRNGVEAKKSWFCVNNIFICLGSDIQTNCNKEIVTGINQTHLKGDAKITYSNGKHFAIKDTVLSTTNIKTVWHDSVGYYFPKNANATLSLKTQKGSWYDIANSYNSETVSGKVFNLSINHGVNASISNRYEYVVLPAISTQKLMSFSKRPTIEVVENRAELQMIKLIDNSIIQIVFHKPFRVKTFTTKEYLQADKPCLLMMENRGSKGVIITVADPTQKLKEINLIVSGKYMANRATYDKLKNETSILVLLPKDNEAGSSLSIDLKQKD